MSITPQTISVPAHRSLTLRGEVVLRGQVEPRSHVDVFGDAKLGRLLEADLNTSFGVHKEDGSIGGTLILTSGFQIPSAGIFIAERSLVLSGESVPERSHIFDNLRFVAPRISAQGMKIENRGRTTPVMFKAADDFADRFPKPLKDSEIVLGELSGPQGGVLGFSFVRADLLANFPASRGWGIVAHRIACEVVRDCLLRADSIRIERVEGLIECMPVSGDPHPDPPDQRGLNPSPMRRRVRNKNDDQRDVFGLFEDFNNVYGSDFDDDDDFNFEERYDRVAVSVGQVGLSDTGALSTIEVIDGDVTLDDVSVVGAAVRVTNGHVSVGKLSAWQSTDPSLIENQTVISAEEIHLLDLPTRELFASVAFDGPVFHEGVLIHQ